MGIINKNGEAINGFKCGEIELSLYRTDRDTYRIDILNTDGTETKHYFEFKNLKEANKFFVTMYKHVFIA